MADFTAKDVKALRDSTGAGMMDAKRALEASEGDAEAAAQLLREKGLAKAGERSDRDNSEGAIGLASNGTCAAIVHLKCETDFSAKSEAFIDVVNVLTEAVLADGTDAPAAHQGALDDLKLTTKENIEVGKVERICASDGELLDTYLHVQDGRGVNAVAVVGSGVEAEQLHQVALHIAFAKPAALHRDEIPADEVDRERQSLLDITKAEGKPEAAWDKIVTGRVNAWLADRVLLEQGLHGEKESVQASLGDASIVSFAQAYLGG